MPYWNTIKDMCRERTRVARIQIAQNNLAAHIKKGGTIDNVNKRALLTIPTIPTLEMRTGVLLHHQQENVTIKTRNKYTSKRLFSILLEYAPLHKEQITVLHFFPYALENPGFARSTTLTTNATRYTITTDEQVTIFFTRLEYFLRKVKNPLGLYGGFVYDILSLEMKRNPDF